MKTAIEIKNLHKSYGEVKVIRGLDLEIHQGEIFALLGVNGAGKTTVLECMEGLRSYEEGEIQIHGKMGIQLQSSALPVHIRPMEAVRLFSLWKKKRADTSLLEEFGIEELSKKQYFQLSIGQKRRLHLALALIADPDILFLDEPTAGLDVEGRLALHSQIRKLKEQGKTIVLASHDMGEVEALCDRIGILREGRMVFCGTAGELTEKMGRRFFLRLETSQGKVTVETEDISQCLLELLNDLKKKKAEVLDIQVDRGTLEQHFIRLAKEEIK